MCRLDWITISNHLRFRRSSFNALNRPLTERRVNEIAVFID